MDKPEKENLLNEIAATAVAITNMTDNKYISEMAAWIADKAISLTNVEDL